MQTATRQCPEQHEFPAISLFSGAGGLDIAAHTVSNTNGSRWKTVACVEGEQDRCDTLRNYFGSSLHVMQHDVRTISSTDILAPLHMHASDVWLVYGGPPCQSFSQAGKQKGACDPRGELIFEFLRFIREVSPPLFLMENVSNLKGIAQGRLLQAILADMQQLGYAVEYRVLNAAHYGTAQKRRRMIFFGTKQTMAYVAHLPEPTHSEHDNLLGLPRCKTVREAFEGIPMLGSTIQE